MDLSPENRQALQRAAQILGASHYLVALSGAGMSAESGIPTYRGPGGLWTRIGEPDPRSYDAFIADPKAWWERTLGLRESQEEPERVQFRQAIEEAEPNPGHYALADLETMGLLKHTITQNVDGLHREAGSRSLSEIHGNRHLLRCMDCSLRLPRSEFSFDEVPPRCAECGGIVKSDGVMFGEPIPRDVLERCFEETDRCDCMLILGTSATVYPAAGFPMQARQRGAYLIEININPTPFTQWADVSLRGPTGEMLPQLAALVRELLQERRQAT